MGIRWLSALVAFVVVAYVGIAVIGNFSAEAANNSWALTAALGLAAAFIAYAAVEYAQTRRLDSIARQFDTRTIVLIPVAIAINIILGQAVASALKIPIYFDSIDNSAYIMGKAEHSARKSWIYINGETFHAARADIGGDPKEPWVNIAWKFVWTAKDTWLGPTQNTGAIPAVYNLTMDPYEKYDMIFNGAQATRAYTNSPGKYSGQDNGWAAALFSQVLVEFDKSVMKYPNIKRFPGGASDDLLPNLQNPANPVPALDPNKMPKAIPGGD